MADEKPPPGRHPGIEPPPERRTVNVMGAWMPVPAKPPFEATQGKPARGGLEPPVAQPRDEPEPEEPPVSGPVQEPQARPPLVRKVTPPPVPVYPSTPIVIKDAPLPNVKTPSMIPGTHYPAKRAATLGGIAVGGASSVTLIALALIGVLPELLRDKTPAQPSKPPVVEPVIQPNCAAQSTVEQVQIEQMKIRKRAKMQAEMICALNGGSPGGGWHCDQQSYQQPRQTPPFYRTDKIYPTDE